MLSHIEYILYSNATGPFFEVNSLMFRQRRFLWLSVPTEAADDHQQEGRRPDGVRLGGGHPEDPGGAGMRQIRTRKSPGQAIMYNAWLLLQDVILTLLILKCIYCIEMLFT